MKVTEIPILIDALWTILKGLKKRAGGVGNRVKSRDHQNYYIVEVSQVTEKSPVDLMWLAVSQTPLKYIQLMVVLKNSQGIIIKIIIKTERKWKEAIVSGSW